MLRKTAGDVVERGPLVRPQSVGFVSIDQIFRLIRDEIGPVKRPAGEIPEAQHLAFRPQPDDGPSGIRAPFVACIHEQAPRERFASGCGNE